MAESNADAQGHPDSPVLPEGVPAPPKKGDGESACYWSGQKYKEGDCVVQNGFYAYSCLTGTGSIRDPDPALRTSKTCALDRRARFYYLCEAAFFKRAASCSKSCFGANPRSSLIAPVR